MAGPKTYVGVSGKARQVKNIYVGVSGKARKVKKVYAGVSGKARLVYSSDWWCPNGISTSDVLAAYLFKGKSSDTEALKDVTGHGYNLTKVTENGHTPTLSSANGYYFDEVWGTLSGYLNNDSLNGKTIKCIIVRYSGLTRTERGFLIGACGSNGKAQVYAASGSYKNGEHYVNYGTPGFVTVWGGNNVGTIKYRNGTMTSGTLCCNLDSGVMYVNGSTSAESLTTKAGVFTDGIDQKKTFGNAHSGMSDWNNGYHAGKYIQAAVFFSKELTAAQQKEVYTALNSM